MKFTATLLAVKDMELSRNFYQEIFGLEVESDFGANIMFTGGLSLQTLDTWKNFIHKKDDDFTFKNNVIEIYFDEDDIDGFVARLAQRDDIEYIHPLIEHSWGQRAIRFYDPDKHIIEVGEDIKLVIKRFMNSGLSIEETAVRMDVSIDFVRSCL